MHNEVQTNHSRNDGFNMSVNAVVQSHHAVTVGDRDVLKEVGQHLKFLVGQIYFQRRQLGFKFVPEK